MFGDENISRHVCHLQYFRQIRLVCVLRSRALQGFDAEGLKKRTTPWLHFNKHDLDVRVKLEGLYVFQMFRLCPFQLVIAKICHRFRYFPVNWTV